MRINLKAERNQRNLKQEEVARKLCITTRHYREIESGNSKGSMEVWEKLKDLFHKPIDYLYVNTKRPDCNQAKGTQQKNSTKS